MKNKTILIIPTIMGIIFINQLYLNFFGTLNPWKGGGFGMFATIDAPGERIIFIEGVTMENDTFELDMNLSKLMTHKKIDPSIATEIISMPTKNKVRKLGRFMKDLHYIESDFKDISLFKKYNISTPYEKGETRYRPLKRYEKELITESIQFKKINITIYKLKFNNDTKVLEWTIFIQPITIA